MAKKKEKVKEESFLEKYKKSIYIVVVVLIVLLGILFISSHSNIKNEKMNDLKIHYSNGKTLKFNSFKKKFTKEYTITVENTSKENKTYSLEWVKVDNGLNAQNKFLYEITCEGDRCATLGKSQVPVTGATVYTQVLIEAGKKQTYTVKFTYDGSEKKSKFNGTLQVYSEEVDQKKIEEQEKKEREKIEKELEEQTKKDSKSSSSKSSKA